MLKGSLILCTWLFFWLGCTTQANSLSLSEQAQNHLRSHFQAQLDAHTQLQIHLDSPDTRLQLEPCGNPIAFSSNRPIQAGRFSLKATCDYPRRWIRHLYGEVQLLREVLISTRPLSKGQQLQASDMRLAAVDQNSLKDGFYTQAQQILGYELNRSVTDNYPLSPKLLVPPILIQPGDRVTIQAGSNGISVEMIGTALEAGALHQQIDVRNNKSERILRARVTGYGRVKAGH